MLCNEKYGLPHRDRRAGLPIPQQRRFALIGERSNDEDVVTEAQRLAWAEVPHRYLKTEEKDHGRIEIRRCWMVEEVAIEWLARREQWPGLASIAAIEAVRRIGEVVTQETRYFISSAALTPERAADAIRACDRACESRSRAASNDGLA